MNKEQLETIKKGYQWWLEAENQADKNEFAECITTEDVPALIAEVERLRETLKFYADVENYQEWPHWEGYETRDVLDDFGKKARQALGDGDE